MATKTLVQSSAIDLTRGGDMLDQRLRSCIDFAITTSRLLRGGTKYKAILKIQLNQRSQEAFYRDFMSSCNLSAVVRLCYICVFFLFHLCFFVVRGTFPPPHSNAALQAQTVLSDGEEKEDNENGC